MATAIPTGSAPHEIIRYTSSPLRPPKDADISCNFGNSLSRFGMCPRMPRTPETSATMPATSKNQLSKNVIDHATLRVDTSRYMGVELKSIMSHDAKGHVRSQVAALVPMPDSGSGSV